MEWRIARARVLQRAFADPTFLGVLAENVLASDRPPREVSELILRVGTPSAYALYSARLKLCASSDGRPSLIDDAGARRRFVLVIREMGTDALPMIRAGLARLEAKRDVPVAAALAADLFKASPRVRDDEAGELASRYVQGSPQPLTSVAVEALCTFWGSRATPLLLGLVGSTDDAVAIAAIAGLREIHAIDEYAVTKIAVAAGAGSREVRAAARAALEDTRGHVRDAAKKALLLLISDRPPTIGARRA
jgi:hypothetical protein